MSLSAIKARLGSLSPARINEMPKSAQSLLEESMPKLIAVAEAAQSLMSEDGAKEAMSQYNALFILEDRLHSL